MFHASRAQLRHVKEWFETFRYKPNVTFEVTGTPVERDGTYHWDNVVLRAICIVIDTYTYQRTGEEHEIEVAHTAVLPIGLDPVEDPRHFTQWVRSWIHRIECHEADEFFIVNGEMPFDPHRERT